MSESLWYVSRSGYLPSPSWFLFNTSLLVMFLFNTSLLVIRKVFLVNLYIFIGWIKS